MPRLPERRFVTSVLLMAALLLGVFRGAAAAWAGDADESHACCPQKLEQAGVPTHTDAAPPQCCYVTPGHAVPVSAIPSAVRTVAAPPAQHPPLAWAAANNRFGPIAPGLTHSHLSIPPLQRTSVLLI